MQVREYLQFLLLIVSALGYSQENLISNGSFEGLDSCPQDIFNPKGTIHHAIGWSNPNIDTISHFSSSPDLYNECSDGYLGVPRNAAGYQIPSTGNGYAGIYIFFERNKREFIQAELKTPLIKGKNYEISCRYVYAQNASEKANKLSFIFSADRVEISDSSFILSGNYFPGVTSDNIVEYDELLLGDTLIWSRLSRVFTAMDSARFLTIGNSRPNSETITQRGWRTNFGYYTNNSYILLDDISLVCVEEKRCDDVGIGGVGTKEVLGVYPNPASTSIQVAGNGTLERKPFTITNLSGITVHSGTMNTSGTLNITACENGFYVLSLEVTPGEFKRAKFMICR